MKKLTILIVVLLFLFLIITSVSAEVVKNKKIDSSNLNKTALNKTVKNNMSVSTGTTLFDGKTIIQNEAVIQQSLAKIKTKKTNIPAIFPEPEPTQAGTTNCPLQDYISQVRTDPNKIISYKCNYMFNNGAHRNTEGVMGYSEPLGLLMGADKYPLYTDDGEDWNHDLRVIINPETNKMILQMYQLDNVVPTMESEMDLHCFSNNQYYGMSSHCNCMIVINFDIDTI